VTEAVQERTYYDREDQSRCLPNHDALSHLGIIHSYSLYQSELDTSGKHRYHSKGKNRQNGNQHCHRHQKYFSS
jgi:hypothetical protein